jgi:prepilin-type N-terminal cleavage/methylation domain-containing protein
MLKKLQKSKSEGFTIIEVMIVLAIAGLILLIVFLAVPALQRNSRNTQRKNDASHLAGLISEYVSNHNGQGPTAGFGTSANQLDLTNESFSIITAPSGALAGTGYTAPSSPALDTFYVFRNTTCNNNTPATGGGNRSYTIVYYTEPGTTIQCVASS